MNHFSRIVFLTLAAGLGFGAQAKTTTWTGNGDWFADPGNWSQGLPAAGDHVVLASGSLVLEASTPALASFRMDGGRLTFRQWDTTLSAGDVALHGGILTHPPQSAAEPVDGVWIPDHRVHIRCVTFTLTTSIDLSARGFRNGGGFNLPGKGPGGGRSGGGGRGAQGGGGYGGHGGDSAGGAGYGGSVYGAPDAPRLWPGSGGGNREQHAGGDGGGLFVLEADGHVTLNGTIRVDGGHAANPFGGGGGSGGGVALRAATLSAANATISANGGHGGTFASGSGGGGRIAISITDPEAQQALPKPDLTLSARFGAQAHAMLYGDYGTFHLDHISLLPSADSGTFGTFYGPVTPDGSGLRRDLRLRLDANGDLTLSAQGHDFVVGDRPSVNRVILESRTLDADGRIAYAFEDADLTDPLWRVLPDGNGLEVRYPWGLFRFRYAVAGNRFDMVLTIEKPSDRTLANLDLRLMDIRFPDIPRRSGNLVSNRDGPAAARAHWGVPELGGALLACIETHDLLQTGFAPAVDDEATRFPWVVRGGIEAFAPGAVEMVPHGLPRIAPGTTRTFRFSLRYVPPDEPEHETLADLYAAFREQYPPLVAWHDRRPIGAIFFDSRGPISKGNPRGWFNDPKLDVFSDAGQAELERRLMQSASNAVKVLTGMGAQGVIVWNVEGEEFPHAISYIGDPRLQAMLAPELNGFIDAYFQVYRDAGLRTGVTLRPTQPFPRADGAWAHGTGSQGPDRNPLDESYDDVWPEGLPWYRFFPIVERLSRKIDFARERWGATLFYVDTNGIHPPMGVEGKHAWMLLDHWIYRELHARHPGILIIPEYARGPACFAVVAPYDQLDYTKRTATPAAVRRLYPEAFVANYVANTAPELLAPDTPWFGALVDAVTHGDVLIHRGWWSGDPNLKDVRAIYQQAARNAPFTVFVGDDTLMLNGDAMPDTAALTAALRRRFMPEPPSLPGRRVRIEMADGRDIVRDLQPVLDAIIDAGGIVAWSQHLPPAPAPPPDR